MRSWVSVLGLTCLMACSGDDGGGEPDGGSAPADTGAPDAGEPDADSGAQQQDGATAGDEPCTSCGACVESRTITSGPHVSGGIDYTDLPPFGGSHDPCWTSFGVHDSEVADEHWVHNLEHGAVVLLHHCPDGCDDEIAALEFLASPRPFVIVMPYAELPTRFAALAWGRRLLTECFDEQAFEEFYERYSNRAPESTTAPGGC